MNKQQIIDTIERRAFEARLTISELCEKAGVHPSSWSRIKRTGNISVKTLRDMEGVLDNA